MSDNIPFEIQVEIMNRLPVKSLLQFRSVSKSWKCMIDSSSFVFTYGVHTDLNLSNHKTIGTSQGLWCFSFGNNLLATLWNPSVKKSIGIFVPVFNNIPVCHKILLGFGVPPDTLDPTIVKISYPVSGQGNWYVSVFTMSSETWDQVANNRLPRESIRFKRSSQVVVGGLIYWLGHERSVSNSGVFNKKTLLVSFDMNTHQFEVIDIPDIIIRPLGFPLTISNIRNSLLLSGNVFPPDNFIFAGQLLSIYDGSITSFTVMYTIPSPYFMMLLGFNNQDEPIVEAATCHSSGHSVQVYNPESDSFNNVTQILGNAGSFYVGPYKESMILATYPDHSYYCAG
ncbi:F-box domain containing protein [Tanacetum coccineum]